MVLILVALCFVAFLCLLHQRALPVIVMRVWYTVNLLGSVVLCWVLCHLVHFLGSTLHLFRRSTCESLSRLACIVSFAYSLRYSSTHVHLKVMEGSLPMSRIQEQHFLCLCHTSFFDTLLFLWLTPYRYLYTAKTFAKSTLRQLPLFGYVVRACGHFPVYFTSTEASSFSVDKEKQAKVAAEVDQFLAHGGSLSFFPEGALNRTPEVLKDFRLGSFNMVLEKRLPLYYCVTYGNHEVWNSSLKGIPGYPADICVYVGKYEYNPDKVDARALATGLRVEMQRHLDDMIALRTKEKYEPWYRPHEATVKTA